MQTANGDALKASLMRYDRFEHEITLARLCISSEYTELCSATANFRDQLDVPTDLLKHVSSLCAA